MRNAERWAAAAIAGALIAGGCKGGGRGDDDDSDDDVVLSTVAGEARDLDLELVDNDCDDDVFDLLDDLDLKLSQVSTGLSVFVYDDLGWVPCEGSIRSFDCRWGDAPGNAPGTWSWRFWGSVSGEELDAQLSLTVECDGGGFGCEDCEAVLAVRGRVATGTDRR